jgi:hypothetical protein
MFSCSMESLFVLSLAIQYHYTLMNINSVNSIDLSWFYLVGLRGEILEGGPLEVGDAESDCLS